MKKGQERKKCKISSRKWKMWKNVRKLKKQQDMVDKQIAMTKMKRGGGHFGSKKERKKIRLKNKT